MTIDPAAGEVALIVAGILVGLPVLFWFAGKLAEIIDQIFLDRDQ